MSTSARRCSLPVAVRCMGGPPGTITNCLPHGQLVFLLEFLNRFHQPKFTKLPGPEWMCEGAVIPGLKIASMYCAE